jgi:aspartate/methionine/tyrosine aminotransferase
MRLAKRMERLGTETAFVVLAKAKALEAQGRDIVHLEIGEPDFDTPTHIIEAGVTALYKGFTHYGASAGLAEFRSVIAEQAGKERGLTFTPDQVVVTPGAKPIMFYVITALVGEGDEAIYPNPGFPIYESMINFMGGRAVPIPLREENDFRLDVRELESLITPRTRLIIVNSPQNPTGGVLTRSDLEAIARLAVKHDITVLTDEVYKHFIYEGQFASILTFPGMLERTILLDGHSKSYAMTGWRLGYGIMPADFAKVVATLQTNAVSCTASFTQRAGMAALTGPQDSVKIMVNEFKRRRDLVVKGLNQIKGIRCREPKGAFYVFPNITGTGKDARFMADYLLNEAGVAVLSGTAFGEYGEGFLRLSYANSYANLEKALERIAGAVAKL